MRRRLRRLGQHLPHLTIRHPLHGLTQHLPHLLTRRPMRRPPRLLTQERLLINQKHEVPARAMAFPMQPINTNAFVPLPQKSDLKRAATASAGAGHVISARDS